MKWTEKIAVYAGQKYLGEIAKEIWDYYRKKPLFHAEPTTTDTIPLNTYIMFIQDEVEFFPPPLKSLIEKGFVQNTFITDQAQRDRIKRERESTSALSTDEIRRTTEAVSQHEAQSVLPDLDNFLFRNGMTEKEFAWHQILELLNDLPQIRPDDEIDNLLNLSKGKIIYWEQNFINMNHRHPELFKIFHYTRELKPDKNHFCREFQCSHVIFDRHPAFNSFVVVYAPSVTGMIIAFQE